MSLSSLIRLFAGLSAVLALLPAQGEIIRVDRSLHYLGDPVHPEWSNFSDLPCEGKERRWTFQSSQKPAVIFLRQRDVKGAWQLFLNDQLIGLLPQNEADLMEQWDVSRAARAGINELRVAGPKEADDTLIGEISFDPFPPGKDSGEAELNISVRAKGGRLIPSRLTITDERGVLMPVRAGDNDSVIRTGVAYTATGQCRLFVRPGSYRIYAGHGPLFSVASTGIKLGPGRVRSLQMTLEREVDLPGYLSCDTHVHTREISGHGDATIRERLVTLAAEDVNVAVITEHNVLADFTAQKEKLGLDSFLSTIMGDEVTTTVGHFNVFPFKKGERAPAFDRTNWSDLLPPLHENGRFVILNHPRDLHSNFRPFEESRLQTMIANREALGFDGVEVINSGAMRSDPREIYRAWFSLLNAGHPLSAVGASDSHDVSRYIVGQGRTYVAARNSGASTREEAVVAGFKGGHLLTSLGLIATLNLDRHFLPGDLATNLGAMMQVEATVLGPSWIGAERLELYLNGECIRNHSLPKPQFRAGEKIKVRWTLSRPAKDSYLVLIASGPGVIAPYWPLAKPYQPSSPDWTPVVLGSTNPIYLDGDGDGFWNGHAP